MRVHAIEFAGLDQRRDDRPVCAAFVVAGEECILSIECDGTDGALDRVGVDLDAAVVKEARQAVPVVQSIVDRLGRLGSARQLRQLPTEPRLQGLDDRLRALLPCRATRISGFASDFIFDAVERADLVECGRCDRRVASFREVVEQAAEVAPAVGERDSATRT